jgi:hypothetical protein
MTQNVRRHETTTGGNMKLTWIKSLALTAAIALPSQAFIGLGAHLAPAFGPEIKGSNGFVMPDGSTFANRIRLMTGSSSGFDGVGVKLWIDFLPIVDVEGTMNVQMGYYDMAFAVDTSAGGTGQYDTIKVDPELNIPFAEAKPFFARVSGDVAVLYPFLKIPLVKFYAGGGLSYIMATPVLSSSFAKKALTNAEAAGTFNADNADADDISDVLIEAMKDEGLTSGIGFFAQVGAKVKPPIIPLAVYANGKYGFGGPSIAGVTASGLTLELGGAIAF